MKQGDRLSEAAPEPIHGLRGEGDLGHEDDRSPPPIECLPRGLQVDLGLPRAGDAVEEELPVTARGNRLQCAPLIAGQLDPVPDGTDRG